MDNNATITKVIYLDDDIMMLENFKLLFKNNFSIKITDNVNDSRKILENEEIENNVRSENGRNHWCLIFYRDNKNTPKSY